MRNCRPYFERELDLLTNLKVLVALGKIAFDQYLDVLKARGVIPSRAPFTFGHNREYSTGSAQPRLISSYHPSQQNTSTGKLTEKMLREVFQRARDLVEAVLARFGHIESIPAEWRDWRVKVTNPRTLADTLDRERDRALLFRTLATLRTDIPLFDDVADVFMPSTGPSGPVPGWPFRSPW